jgi:hypothetical protein
MDGEYEPGGAPAILYVEAFDRVGVWDLSLTDDEYRDLQGGLWQASSASAYRSTEAICKGAPNCLRCPLQ